MKRFGEDARTYDFLETGRTDLVYDPRAPGLTPAQIEAMEYARVARTAQENREKARKTAQRNETYDVLRAQSDQKAIAFNNYIANQPWNKAKIDWGLLPAAAKVTLIAVSTAATGGLAAPSVATLWSDVKKGIGSIDSAGDAAKTAFKVKDYVEDEFIAANAAADRILSELNVENAKGVIANTQALAIAGDVDAQRGAVILAKVANERRKAGVGPGQALIPVQSAEQASIVAKVERESAYPMTAADRVKVSDVRHSWFQRFLDWLRSL